MLDRLNDYSWMKVFECAGYEPAHTRDQGWGYIPSRDNEPRVFGVLGYVGDVSGFTRDDVEEIYAIDEGYNDGPSWIGVFRLKDGRFASVEAGCDYTGWDCQSGGSACIASTLEDAVMLGLSDEDRRRLLPQLQRYM